MKVINWDLETGSEADLNQVGVYVYAAHPSTRAHVLKYTFDRGRTMQTWHIGRGDPLPADLDAAFDDPTVMFEGWNANFERIIFRDVLNIEIPIRRFRCTMARARAMALPGGLGLCGKALGVEWQKGDDSVMRRWMKPQADGSWASDPQEYDDLCFYCGLDVIAEISIGEVLRELSDEEWQDYWTTEEVNDRGLPVDLELAKAAQAYALAELHDIKRKLNILTRAQVTSPKQFQRIKAWLNDNLPPDMKLEPDDDGKVSFDRATREELLAPDNEDAITGEVREFIELIHDGGRASTAKFLAMQSRAGADGRVRGAYVYNGAGQTGRFSSSGLQVHNFVRKKLPDVESVVDAIIERVHPDELVHIASYNAGQLVVEPGESEPLKRPYDVMTILSRCLRPAITAEPGKTLVWGDWEQIEARVLPWLSGQNSANELLEVFARGEDVYTRQAALTYNVPIDQVTKTMRQNGGKIPVLSFGFGGGAGAVLAMARAYGVSMTREEAEKLKDAWRLSNPWAQRFWMRLEGAAYIAVAKGTEEHVGKVKYHCEGNVLWCTLPSGRLLAYPYPAIEKVPGRFGEQWRVTCMKGSWHPKKGEKKWPRMALWGGIQAENITQAEAASLLRYACRELSANGWPLIGHTHDELLLEVLDDEVEDAKVALHDIMVNAPPCYAGLPLAAEVRHGFSYGK